MYIYVYVCIIGPKSNKWKAPSIVLHWVLLYSAHIVFYSFYIWCLYYKKDMFVVLLLYNIILLYCYFVVIVVVVIVIVHRYCYNINAHIYVYTNNFKLFEVNVW